MIDAFKIVPNISPRQLVIRLHQSTAIKSHGIFYQLCLLAHSPACCNALSSTFPIYLRHDCGVSAKTFFTIVEPVAGLIDMTWLALYKLANIRVPLYRFCIDKPVVGAFIKIKNTNCWCICNASLHIRSGYRTSISLTNLNKCCPAKK